MTEGMFNTFIRSLLRRGSMRWPPIYETLREARVERGVYLCNGCGNYVPASLKINGKRVKNAVVDHRSPVVDPSEGRVDWNKFIERLFCEQDNLQLLCLECHMKKSLEEKKLSTLTRRQKKEKELNE